MAKRNSLFICTACGTEFPKWVGRCSQCGQWNAVAQMRADHGKAGAAAGPRALSAVSGEGLGRRSTGMEEFNLVTGGGLVPGSVVLIGGDPGIGKSTLALQVAHSMKSVYLSGEESPLQIRQRAERLNLSLERIHVSTATAVDDIVNIVQLEKPECVIVDSVQTLYCSDTAGYAGSVSQIRESAARLVQCAKQNSSSFLLIGHITKDGAIAGPKVLEHMVDTVLYFEGDFARDFRVLRAVKNRYGSVNEMGLFRMTSAGLEEVKERHSLFLNASGSTAPGTAVSTSLEGSRTILFEVQSLVTATSFSNPRRMADGFDLNRLILIVAVLEKHGFLKLGSFDVFINVAGGFHITETSADLAVAMSIVSSLIDKPIPRNTGLIGEIALSGEVRPVPHARRRIQEFARSGFQVLLLPAGDAAEAVSAGFSGRVVEVDTIAKAIGAIFGP